MSIGARRIKRTMSIGGTLHDMHVVTPAGAFLLRTLKRVTVNESDNLGVIPNRYPIATHPRTGPGELGVAPSSQERA